MFSSLRLFAALTLLIGLPIVFFACSGSGGSAGNDGGPGSGIDGAGGGSNDATMPNDGGADADASDGAKDADADAGDGEGGIKGKPKTHDGGDADQEDAEEDAGDASTEAGVCVVAMSGAVSGVYECNAAVGLSGQTGLVLSITLPDYTSTTFETTFSGAWATGNYGMGSGVASAGAVVSDTSGGVWLMAYNQPSNNQGTISVTVDNAGQAYMNSTGTVWLNAYGSALAELPAVAMDPFASGTVTMDIRWATFAYPPDGGMPDSGMDSGMDGGKDGASASGACYYSASGGISVPEGGCSVAAYYIDENDAGVPASTLSLTLTPPAADGGSLGTFVFVNAEGQFNFSPTLSNTSSTVLGSAAGVTRTYGDASVQSWTELSGTALDSGAAKGSFTMTFSTYGAQDPTPAGFNYVGLHGHYQGNLVLTAGDGGPTTTLQVGF